MNLRPVPHTCVTFNDRFWAPRIETNRLVTLPIEYEQCRKTGRIGMWNWKPGRPNPPHIFWDSDVAKWLEAAAGSLATHPDRELERQADAVIEGLAGIQMPDGYLNTHYALVEPEKRWTNLRDCHELYCAGHLMEAAVAYFEATGKRRFLDVMCRYADCIADTFGPRRGQKRGYCGHPEIELALMRLYRATGERRYFELARFFVEERGRKPCYFEVEARARGDANWKSCRDGNEYFQAHAPLREQRDAVGHAVRALYLYSGAADVAAAAGDAGLMAACRRLWRSVTTRRMYVTGGAGSSRHGERFTCDYDLPNELAYAETCAAIALVFFAQRMLAAEGNGIYADVLERALYNGVLSGVDIEGRRFFYANPLAAHPVSYAARPGEDKGAHTALDRQEWFGCACCPTNIVRLLASLGQYFYGVAPRALFVHLYAGGEATAEVAGQSVRITQTTDYPWDGRVRIAVDSARPAAFTIALRIPGWCRVARLAINGRPVTPASCLKRGYARLNRVWQAGDRIELSLPMPIERIEARPEVRSDCGRIALQRGPLVYCLEEIDNGPHLADIALPRGATLTARRQLKLLGGCVTIEGHGCRRAAQGWGSALYRPAASQRARVTVRAVPYFLWNNRGSGEMRVWIGET
jgi:DUF1680 family protein